MTLRYLAVVVLLSAVGAGLLGLRQQQLNDKHAMAVSHAEMKESREHIKDLQVRIAKMTRPEALKEAIDRTELRVEPIARRISVDEPDEAEAEASDG
jgi:hypothetical protein